MTTALLLAVAAGVVACGGSREPVAPEAFAGDVCDAFVAFGNDVEELRGELREQVGDTEDDEEIVEGLTTFLGGAADRVERLSRQVEDAGVPDIRSGEQAVDDLQAALAEVEELFRRARQQAADLPVDDATGLEEGRSAIAGDLQRGSAEIDEAVARLSAEYPELDLESCATQA